MSDKVYDRLAIIGRLLLPALGALYFALAKIWNLPLATEITGTIAALTTFLNAVLKIKSDEYFASLDEGSDDDGVQ